MSLAVFAERAPFVRTVRCRTAANTLSIGFDVRRWSQCSVGKSKKASSASRSLVRQATALSCLALYLSSQRIVDGLTLTEKKNSGISRHGVSLLSGGSGRLETRIAQDGAPRL